jgi:hypothetical protein
MLIENYMFRPVQTSNADKTASFNTYVLLQISVIVATSAAVCVKRRNAVATGIFFNCYYGDWLNNATY